MTNSPQDNYIKLGSVNIRYWSRGEGKPIILLHGGGSSIEIWSFNFGVLAQYYHVYAFDMVGTGKSDKPSASYSLDYQTEFLQKFMNALDIDCATLIGNSMEGSIALKLALKSPERVNKLVLVSSFGLGREISFFERFLGAFPAIAFLAKPSRRGAKMVLSPCVYDSKSLLAEWIELSYRLFKLPGTKQAIISLIKNNIDLWGVKDEVFKPIVNRLESIAAPTLIVWGKQDKILPIKHAYIAANKIPHNSLHLFDRCGHWAQVEYPQQFNQLTLEFLLPN